MLKTKEVRTAVAWHIPVLVGFIALGIMGLIGYSLSRANHIAITYSSQIDAVMMIRYEATKAHLWFEEIISGDRHESIDQVWESLDESAWYVGAMLDGGENWEGTFIAVNDQDLREEILQAQEHLVRFRSIADQRYAAQVESGAGSAIDQRFDDIFRDFLHHGEQVEVDLRKLMNGDLAQFRAVQLGFIAIIGILSMAVGSSLHLANRRKVKDLARIKEANRDNQEQREFLDNVLESLTHPFYVIDADDYTIKLANSSAIQRGGPEVSTCHMLSHRRDEPCDGVDDPCPVQEIKKTRKPMQVEHIHYDKDGNQQNVEVHAYPILDNDGNVTEIIEYSLDISERKQAEQALRESEEKYKTLYESSRDAIMMLTAEEGFFHGNAAAVELFGCKDFDEFITKTPSDLSPEYQPDGIASTIKAQEVMAIALEDGSHFFEWTHKRISGEEFYATVLLTRMELEGQHILQATVRDISALKEAENEKRQQWEMLKITFDTAPVGMLLLEEDMRIRYVNKSVINTVGKEACEIVDKKPGEGLCCSNFHSSNADCGSGPHCESCPIRQMIESVIKSGLAVHQCEAQVALFVDGTEINPWFKISVEPVEMHGSRHAIVVLEDVTRWKQSEEELRSAKEKAEAASQAKSQFLANMSHEIRTPMNAIIGFSDILQEEPLSETQKNYIDTISNSGQHLLHVIDDVLDFSKIEAGKLEVETEECSLKQVLRVIDSMMQEQASEKGLEFAIEEDGDLPANIYTDSSRLQQCLINLSNNAIKFTEHGYVHIHVSSVKRGHKPYIQFDVIDTGVGVPVEKQKKIFESFTQADGSTSRKYGGTGLGLTITKQLAEMLGGELTVSSEKDEGSVFSLVIPSGLDMIDQPSLSRYNIVEQIDAETNKMKQQKFTGRVLVAEDVLTNQMLAKSLLSRMGLEVSIASDGIEAVEMAISQEFDVIFMDIQMPNMNGYEATQALREKGVTTPIIALTAHAMRGDEEKCLSAGCDDYLAKPIDRQELCEKLSTHLPLNAPA